MKIKNIIKQHPKVFLWGGVILSTLFLIILVAACCVGPRRLLRQVKRISTSLLPASPTVEEQVELKLNETIQLHVEHASGTVTFSSGDETVATVDEEGIISPVSEGTATIFTHVRHRTLSTEVTVYKYSQEDLFRMNNYGDYQPETSLAALTLIGMCSYYNDYMMSDSDPWYNSNYGPISRAETFEEMTTKPKKGCNCNGLTNWSLIDMGVFAAGHGIYGTKDRKVHNYNDGSTLLKKELDAACDVVDLGSITLKELVENDRLIPGDILCGKLHTYIYRGDGTLFVSASDASHYRNDAGEMIFNTWVMKADETYNWDRKVNFMVRLKEDYIPQYYRDKIGKLLPHPMAKNQKTAK